MAKFLDKNVLEYYHNKLKMLFAVKRKITQAEYDALTEAEKNNGTIYFITDAGGGGGGSYVLPIASATTLGGVKVGNNLSISSDGTLSASGGGGGTTIIGSNPNLIDNPWFTIVQSLNQSGSLIFPFPAPPGSTECFIDRWRYKSGDGYITLMRNQLGDTRGLEIDNREGTMPLVITQAKEGNLKQGDVTVSVMLDDGTIHHATGNIDLSQTGTHEIVNFNIENIGNVKFTVSYLVDNFMSWIDISINTGVQKIIKAVKLEYGKYSTLENDGPPDYRTELLKCMYYKQLINVRSFGFAVSNGGKGYYVNVPLNAPMKRSYNANTLKTYNDTELDLELTIWNGTAYKEYGTRYLDSTGMRVEISDVKIVLNKLSFKLTGTPNSTIPNMGIAIVDNYSDLLTVDCEI